MPTSINIYFGDKDGDFSYPRSSFDKRAACHLPTFVTEAAMGVQIVVLGSEYRRFIIVTGSACWAMNSRSPHGAEPP